MPHFLATVTGLPQAFENFPPKQRAKPKAKAKAKKPKARKPKKK